VGCKTLTRSVKEYGQWVSFPGWCEFHAVLDAAGWMIGRASGMQEICPQASVDEEKDKDW